MMDRSEPFQRIDMSPDTEKGLGFVLQVCNNPLLGRGPKSQQSQGEASSKLVRHFHMLPEKHQSSPSCYKVRQVLHGHNLGISENVDRKYWSRQKGVMPVSDSKS